MKKILIIFPDSHIFYSPTTLNIQKSLSEKADVKILVLKTVDVSNSENKDIIAINEKALFFRLLNFTLNYLCFIKKFDIRYTIYKKWFCLNYIIKNNIDEVICVDLISLWYVQWFKKKDIHLLSLELTANTLDYFKKVQFSKVDSIIIQSVERLSYLLNNNTYNGKVYYIQNAPTNITLNEKNIVHKNKLLYVGTARFQFGIQYCLEFINTYNEYSLTIQGKMEDNVVELIQKEYNHLLHENRLIINNNYLSEKALLEYINKFRIAFCFYDLNFPEINNFNYYSAPSGKMFSCLSAGVPIIGTDVSGLSIIKTNNAGVLLNEYSPQTILSAINEIELDYMNKKLNCFEISKTYDFSKTVLEFKNYILTKK